MKTVKHNENHFGKLGFRKISQKLLDCIFVPFDLFYPEKCLSLRESVDILLRALTQAQHETTAAVWHRKLHKWTLGKCSQSIFLDTVESWTPFILKLLNSTKKMLGITFVPFFKMKHLKNWRKMKIFQIMWNSHFHPFDPNNLKNWKR